MDIFTEVYSKLIDLLKTKSLDSSWSTIEADLKALCKADGPSSAKSTALQSVRDAIFKASKDKANVKKASAEEILKAAKTGSAGFQNRAALIKTFKHFYCVTKKGNQFIWVVDHPRSYSAWAFDQLDGKSEEELKGELKKEREVFGESRRNMLSDSLQLARKWSMDVEAKLGSPDATTLSIVKRWFHTNSATDEELKATAATLLAGFKKISATCNSTTTIFSDRPHKRASGDWDNTYASVNAGDAMPIIYIFQAFLKTGRRNNAGNIPKLWLCALTVVHELSHKLVSTKDKSYDYQGLKPGSSITVADAIINADSWGYFCADLVGALTKGTVKRVLK
jgi:hypothetical protein